VPVRHGTTLATRLGAVPEGLLTAGALAALAAGLTGAAWRRRTSTTTGQQEQEES
jgi:fructose-1,6-bisphosphatase/sedoheptulose 1,7-bisphosphatase-like protein